MSGSLDLLTGIRLEAQQRTMMTNNNVVTTSEWNSYINKSLFELYDLLVQKYGNDYFVADPYTFTTDGSTNYYALPKDFYKGLLVEIQLGGGQQGWVRIRNFNFEEADKIIIPNLPTVWGPTDLRYRFRANTLWLAPTAASGQQIRLTYVPRLTPLVDNYQTITVGNSVANRDTITIGGTLVLTAGTDFAINPLAQTTAQNAMSLAEAIAAQGDTLGVAAAVSGSIVYIGSKSGALSLATSNPAGFTLGGSSIPAGGVTDGFSGWTEYVIVDACIKALAKQELETGMFAAQKQALIARIEAAAENRDAGSPATTVDVLPSGSNWFPWGGGPGGWSW